MLEKIASLRTLRSLNVLSKSFVSQVNTTTVRTYSSRLVAPTCTRQISCLPKPITFKNVITPSSLQVAKIVGNNLIQKRSMSSHGDHVNIWKLERVVSAAFVPLLPLCLILENPILDGALAILSVIHVHWGLEAIIVDYARPIVVGPIVPKVCMAALYALSAVTLAGLLVLIYNGPGISKAIKQGWAIGKDK
ncbi:succinate dehydrogenase [ubiquinone] cytochrome b small subunit, mitochondrial [Trichogramma pretiosum]|uniref:Succinate dehydrogenase [ubiquinone] cytochrome b small subunit n=1 Tax=Trichogramma kaykai TaxID=54128 RepID=A0ABD2X581_9HYME|nr:succinate dehydrogenase [ubiquinone] cytochrome b small subunit, mitochondrial [Trichogramma pretiosum]